MGRPGRDDGKQKTSGSMKKTTGYRGDVPGCYVGQMFEKRANMMAVKMHQQSQAGIDGREDCGCYSIVMSAGYEDDEDEGEVITYTGCGGMDGKSGTLIRDQEFSGKNASLVVSHLQDLPVRVIRGHNCPSAYAPLQGYRYDGLYKVVEYWKETQLSSGFAVCRFKLVRLPDQPPLVKTKKDYQRKKREPGKVIPPPRALRRKHAYVASAPIEEVEAKMESGFCVVCERVIEGGCGPDHIEEHVRELWDTFDDADKEKLSVRSYINAERINGIVEYMVSEAPIASSTTSTVFSWP